MERVILRRGKKFRLSSALMVICVVVSFGVTVILYTLASAQAAVTIDPGTGATVTGVATKATDATAGTTYVKFGTAVAVYCGGRVPDAQCIGASAWLTHSCATLAACKVAGFQCWASNDATHWPVTPVTPVSSWYIYDLGLYAAGSTNTGGVGSPKAHSGGPDEVRNPSTCGKDVHTILTRAVADNIYGTIPSSTFHNNASANNQATFTYYKKVNWEYDSTKP